MTPWWPSWTPRVDEPTTATAIVTAISSATRLPHVAVELGGTVCAEVGIADVSRRARIPIVRNGESLGAVVVTTPVGCSDLGAREATMIDQIVRHAGSALHAQRLGTDVERSRAALVVAREAERRRLRRELHDGIGPSLAALGLQLDAIRGAVADPATAASLDRISGDLSTVVTDVRRVASGLRPPALDELGLRDALDERSRALNATFQYDAAEEPTPTLPAALDVAIYLIASEALSQRRPPRSRLAPLRHAPDRPARRERGNPR